MISPEILHYLSIALAVMLSSMGTALGEGLAGAGSLGAVSQQPMSGRHNFRALLIGMSLTESGGILALVMAFILLFAKPEVMTWGIAWGHLGIGAALGIAGASVGIATGYAVKGACKAISRQPFFAPKIVTIMALSQTMIEAPVIFSFIVALLIKTRVGIDTTLFEGLKYAAAGCAMGIGTIGPALGQAFFSYASCRAVGINRESYQRVFGFTIFSQTLIETPVVFCLLVATLLIFKPISQVQPLISIVSFCAAALCVSVAASGTGIGTGYVASRSCYQIGHPKSEYQTLFRSTILAQVFIEASVIYALIVSMILIMR